MDLIPASHTRERPCGNLRRHYGVDTERLDSSPSRLTIVRMNKPAYAIPLFSAALWASVDMADCKSPGGSHPIANAAVGFCVAMLMLCIIQALREVGFFE